jgi:RimJ/RimL family protein N-acetyltransferase
MRLRGETVIIRPQVREDLDVMRAWRPFTDPLFITYNLPSHSSVETDTRIAALSGDPTRRWYTIEDLSGQVIGRISLREINGQRSARLGITIGADWVGQGYGTDAIHTFLDYYFGELGFAILYLDVAAPNRRAIRCYEKCGFRRISEEYRDAGSDTSLAFLRDEKYRHVRHFFIKRGKKNLVLFYEMRLDRQDWTQQPAKEPGQNMPPLEQARIQPQVIEHTV